MYSSFIIDESEPLMRKLSLDDGERVDEPDSPSPMATNSAVPPQPETLWQQMWSKAFFGVLIWMTISLFWANFYVGTVVEQIFSRSGDNPPTTRFYTNIFNIILPVGVFGIPAFGRITDQRVRLLPSSLIHR
jgi:fatty acid desaturase